jgi:translocator protein
MVASHMSQALTLTSELLLLLSLACFLVVLAHGFRRSLGTGFMVLLIPFYQVVYGFTQFEHRRRGLVLAGWLWSLLVAMVFRVAAMAAMR